jgi:GNAT superfamily N-acetyltransferase
MQASLRSVAVGAALGIGVLLALKKIKGGRRRFSERFTVGKDGLQCVVRTACREDVRHLFRFTHDLAAVCDELHELIEIEAGMLRAFDLQQYEALIVEVPRTTLQDPKVVGMAVFQESYRTWSGNSLYLQDLIIAESYRGQGLGTLVLQILARLALDRGCNRLFWESTVDNDKARDFYAGPTVGAKHADELITWKLVEGLEPLASRLPRPHRSA